jgi:hypothetical protein
MNTNEIEIWKERFADRKSKGLTVKDWCLENGLARAKYYRWYKIVNESESIATTTQKTVFAEVKVPKKTATCDGLKISFNDLDISISSKDDIALAVAFIQELQKRC